MLVNLTCRMDLRLRKNGCAVWTLTARKTSGPSPDKFITLRIHKTKELSWLVDTGVRQSTSRTLLFQRPVISSPPITINRLGNSWWTMWTLRSLNATNLMEIVAQWLLTVAQRWITVTPMELVAQMVSAFAKLAGKALTALSLQSNLKRVKFTKEISTAPLGQASLSPPLILQSTSRQDPQRMSMWSSAQKAIPTNSTLTSSSSAKASWPLTLPTSPP